MMLFGIGVHADAGRHASIFLSYRNDFCHGFQIDRNAKHVLDASTLRALDDGAYGAAFDKRQVAVGIDQGNSQRLRRSPVRRAFMLGDRNEQVRRAGAPRSAGSLHGVRLSI